ncbi:Retrotransposon gag domain [Dillenia turbinata]|uniref:Retrotransposon gag domain n=1 Tax=Dillenia turbinata TaxID=194707 RepID=A0AAN8UWY0_9MAGN
MKSIMRSRFVPPYHTQQLHNQLQNLKQGSRTAEEYCTEMKRLMTRIAMVEDEGATKARFLGGRRVYQEEEEQPYHLTFILERLLL